MLLNNLFTDKKCLYVVLLCLACITVIFSNEDEESEYVYNQHDIDIEYNAVIGEENPGDVKLSQMLSVIRIDYFVLIERS